MAKFHQNTNPGKPQNRRIVLPSNPLHAESRAVSKKVLTLDEAQKAKMLERFEIFDDQPRLCMWELPVLRTYRKGGLAGAGVCGPQTLQPVLM